jgi:hypothetical protein
MKRAKGTIDGMNPKAWMDYMFDHTTIIAKMILNLILKIWTSRNYPT